jgi:spermidine/putrescine transport system substrate-binding protein
MTDPKDQLRVDPALLRGMTQRRISRRDLLRYAGVGAGALSASAILAACGAQNSGSGGGGASGSSGPQIDWNAKPNGTLNFANWPLYIDKQKDANGDIVYPSLVQFTKQTGIEINYTDPINANPSFFGKIQPQLQNGQYTGYDVIVITNGITFDQLVKLGYVEQIPADVHPNFDKYASEAVKSPSYDPGNKYSMAWQSGLTGIAWDPVQVAALRPSKPTVDSFEDLFDPAFKGKVGMFSDNQDMPCLTLVGMGVVPETSTETDWNAAAAKLQKQKDDGIVRQYYDQSYTNALQNGDIALTMGWSGDVFQLNLEGDAKGLQFAVPKEGVIIWTDNMMIPRGVENPVDAITYMDYVYQPEVQAIMEDWINYISPVPAAQKVVLNQLHDPTVGNSPLVFPTQSDLSSAHRYYVFKSDQEEQTWNALFQPIYQG